MLPVHTFGEARKLGWRVCVRCLLVGDAPKSRHDRKAIFCETSAELEMKTLVWRKGLKCLGGSKPRSRGLITSPAR